MAHFATAAADARPVLTTFLDPQKKHFLSISMTIFTNARKSVDYKDFITQNVHPATYNKIKGEPISDRLFYFLSEGEEQNHLDLKLILGG